MWRNRVLLLLLLFCARLLIAQNNNNLVYLDQLDFSQIIAHYGTPHINQSFGMLGITIRSQSFERGLGVHAPISFCIQVNKRFHRFQTIIGIDSEITLRQKLLLNNDTPIPNYVYGIPNHLVFKPNDFNQGASVIFKISSESKLLYKSSVLHRNDQPKIIDLDISDCNQLFLEVLPSDDGSFNDHANWAMARLIFKEDSLKGLPEVTNSKEDIFVNHIGYKPYSFKEFLYRGSKADSFMLINAANRVMQLKSSVYKKNNFYAGDFSNFKVPGKYYILIGNLRSDVFSIDENVYSQVFLNNLEFFKKQRCGHPEAWNGLCHSDDGREDSTGLYKNLSGGWHDACDLRKWSANIGNIIALEKAFHSANASVKKNILDEIRWGNKYYHALQSPKGYLMNGCGTAKKDNRWTDNKKKSGDERLYFSTPTDTEIQLQFALSQILCARLFFKDDESYAHICLNAAERCWRWLQVNNTMTDSILNPVQLGITLSLLSTFYKASLDESYLQKGNQYLLKLNDLQAKNGDLAGCFFHDTINKIPHSELFKGSWFIVGLCDWLDIDHKIINKTLARNMLELNLEYLKRVSSFDDFGFIPVYASKNKAGSNFYMDNIHFRYFYPNPEDNSYWNGTNPHLLFYAIGLKRMGFILNDSICFQLMQKQLDWVMGRNYFNVSFITENGYRHPDLFKTGEFTPHTPLINGGVMAGIGADKDGKPVLNPGYWNTCEYWSPAVAWMLWLLAIQ